MIVSLKSLHHAKIFFSPAHNVRTSVLFHSYQDNSESEINDSEFLVIILIRGCAKSEKVVTHGTFLVKKTQEDVRSRASEFMSKRFFECSGWYPWFRFWKSDDSFSPFYGRFGGLVIFWIVLITTVPKILVGRAFGVMVMTWSIQLKWLKSWKYQGLGFSMFSWDLGSLSLLAVSLVSARPVLDLIQTQVT